MKEALRKLQWCPHREGAGQDCIGSVCSQWRWDAPVPTDIERPPPYIEVVDTAGRRVKSIAHLMWGRGPDGMLARLEPEKRPEKVDGTYRWRSDHGWWERPRPIEPGERDGHCGLSGKADHD